MSKATYEMQQSGVDIDTTRFLPVAKILSDAATQASEMGHPSRTFRSEMIENGQVIAKLNYLAEMMESSTRRGYPVKENEIIRGVVASIKPLMNNSLPATMEKMLSLVSKSFRKYRKQRRRPLLSRLLVFIFG